MKTRKLTKSELAVAREIELDRAASNSPTETKCSCCGLPARKTVANEGYSECCNDLIVNDWNL